MNHNIIYIFPIKHNRKNENVLSVSNKILFLVYSILLTNAFLSGNIILYTDMDGLSIFSILPIEIKVLLSKNLKEMKILVKEKQKEPYLLLNYNNYLKSDLKYNRKINIKQNGLELSIGGGNFEKVNIDIIKKRLEKYLGIHYERLINRINTVIG